MGHIVVGVDGSEESLRALKKAIDEAVLRRADLHVLHAVDLSPALLHLPHDVTVDTRDLANEQRTKVWTAAQPILEDAGLEVVRVDREGRPGQTLVEYCAEIGAELLVVGTRGRGRVKSFLLGSTAQDLANSETCDLMLVR
ncbi:MAG TPA: universal stress protein [Acidimicrobiia bacterium]|nr:universal stress protein [Acidimicrobiia bacterium]